MTQMKSVMPTPKHLNVRAKLLALVQAEMADVPADEILAVLSYTVGQLIAFQDQRKITPEMALKIVSNNIEAGNASALEESMSAGGFPS